MLLFPIPGSRIGHLCKLAATACLLLNAAQGLGQQPADLAETPLEKLGSVQVYSAPKRLQTLIEAPSFVTVITGDQIRKFGYRTLAEVLQSVPGFYPTTTAITPTSEYGDFRGRGTTTAACSFCSTGTA